MAKINKDSLKIGVTFTRCSECDRVEVRHGNWVESEIPKEKYVCSVCGGACWYYDYQGEVTRSRYCPNCGAKMDGGKTE